MARSGLCHFLGVASHGLYHSRGWPVQDSVFFWILAHREIWGWQEGSATLYHYTHCTLHCTLHFTLYSFLFFTLDKTVIFEGINQNVSVCSLRFVHICRSYLWRKPEMPKTWRNFPKTGVQRWWSGVKLSWRKNLLF